MNWYDVIAPLYDRAVGALYRPYREKAVQALRLKPAQTVVDLGCGSGLNFELIMDAIGTDGTLIGIDVSTAMLKRAREAVERHGWTNVYLVQRDVHRLGQGDLDALTGRKTRVDRTLCTLGLSVFPAWQQAFASSFAILASDGRYCVMDLFNEERTFHTRLIDALARSEISRRIWEPLQRNCVDYAEERHPLTHGRDVVVIASGTKPRQEGPVA